MTNENILPFALIKTAMESLHVPVLINGHNTHDAATRFVAQLSAHVPRASMALQESGPAMKKALL